MFVNKHAIILQVDMRLDQSPKLSLWGEQDMLSTSLEGNKIILK